MQIIIKVTADLERLEGMFASKDELAEQLMDELEAAIPGDLEGDNGGVYEVVDTAVERVV